MAKVTEWRKKCPKNIFANQIRALEADVFFVIRQSGPLAFSVQELGKKKPFEVRIGDPHRCTCRLYRLTPDLCIHICWIILKKFCISIHSTISFQRGMSDQELQKYVHGKERKITRSFADIDILDKSEVPRKSMILKPVRKRASEQTDTCPICLDLYSPVAPVVHCKYSCGNAVHARCLAMLIRHNKQKNSTPDESSEGSNKLEMIKCPLCRGNFDTLAGLKLEIQRVKVRSPPVVGSLQIHDQTCRYCEVKPVRGNLYRCLQCDQIFLCSLCISKKDFRVFHGNHDYAIKQKSDGPWRLLGKMEDKFEETKLRKSLLNPIRSSNESFTRDQFKKTNNDSNKYGKMLQTHANMADLEKQVECTNLASIPDYHFHRLNYKYYRPHNRQKMVNKFLAGEVTSSCSSLGVTKLNSKDGSSTINVLSASRKFPILGAQLGKM